MVEDDFNEVNIDWINFKTQIAFDVCFYSKTLIKPKPKKSPSQKSSDEYVEELKSMLQEKEMTITDLRLESKITNHRLEELENTLRKREEETYLIRKNNDYFEKVIKSKLID